MREKRAVVVHVSAGEWCEGQRWATVCPLLNEATARCGLNKRYKLHAEVGEMGLDFQRHYKTPSCRRRML